MLQVFRKVSIIEFKSNFVLAINIEKYQIKASDFIKSLESMISDELGNTKIKK